MSRLLQSIRTHPKKSVVFSLAAVYGAKWAQGKYYDRQLMKALCAEAAEFGRKQQPLSREVHYKFISEVAALTGPLFVSSPLYKVTVILNPAAAGGSAKKSFENYCAPILHLAGIKVSLIRTEAEGQAMDIMAIMEDTDAVLVAGGDGTMMEAVTGMLRRALFPVASGQSEVALMANAAMACVKQLYRPMDVMQVENISDDEELHGKKVYGLVELQMGAFRDAQKRLGKYWYWAGLDKVMCYVFAYTTSAKEMLWKCLGDFEVASTFHTEQQKSIPPEEPVTKSDANSKRWWHSLIPSGGGKRNTHGEEVVAQPRRVFDWLGKASFEGSEFSIQTPNILHLTDEKVQDKTLKFVTCPEKPDFVTFVREGYRRAKATSAKSTLAGQQTELETKPWESASVQGVRFSPSEELLQREGINFSLDNESVDLTGPIEVSLLQDHFVMFCSPETKVELPNAGESAQKAAAASQQPWWKRSSGSQLHSMPAMKQRTF